MRQCDDVKACKGVFSLPSFTRISLVTCIMTDMEINLINRLKPNKFCTELDTRFDVKKLARGWFPYVLYDRSRKC